MVSTAKLEPGFTGNLFLDSLSSASAECLLRILERYDGSLGTAVAHTLDEAGYIEYQRGRILKKNLDARRRALRRPRRYIFTFPKTRPYRQLKNVTLDYTSESL